nr:restriction endonuclease [Enterococcus sp. BWR-S5]
MSHIDFIQATVSAPYVFITTSRFSSGAQEFAKNQGIVLMDGIKLAELMMQYDVGIEVAKVYKQFHIDNDYFEKKLAIPIQKKTGMASSFI